MTVAAPMGTPLVSLTFPVSAAVVTPCPETTEDPERNAAAKKTPTDDFSDCLRVIAASRCVYLRDATGFRSHVKAGSRICYETHVASLLTSERSTRNSVRTH